MEVITTHINADFDTLASMIAARKLYPEAAAVFPGSAEKAVRDFLKWHPVPGFKYLNPKQIDMDGIGRLILVDVRQKERIGPFAEIIGKPGLDIHIYDHHPATEGDIRGSLEATTPCGATTTIMVKLLKNKKVPLTPQEATAMMLGIYEDTGSLSFISTTQDDYLAAAWLLSKGADLKIISEMIKKEMTSEEISLLNDLHSNALIHRISGQDIVITSASSEEYMEDAALLIQKMMDMNNFDALFALLRMGRSIYLIARSRAKEVDAGVAAARLGGGGHPTAASAAIKDLTLIEAEEKLIDTLFNTVKGKISAGSIMSSPVKSIAPGKTLKECKEIFAKFNINVLPVVDDGKLIGLISRQEAGKAIYHGLSGHSIREFMTSDFSTIAADGPLSMVQEIIIEENQKFLPVMRGDRVEGCITRTDILRVLHYDTLKALEPVGKKAHGKNLGGIMEGRLPQWLRDVLKSAGSIADSMGIRAYLVGGFVRDLILGNQNLDIDIVVEGDGIAYAGELAAHLKGRTRGHKKFGTAVVILPGGFKIDVATARMEFYKTPAALPTVEAGPIKMDLHRRDFTINAMAVKLNSRSFGDLIDFFGGMKDIKEKAVRALHSISFIEDPTRAFRAVRLEQRLGFQIGRQSLALIRNAARLDFFDKVSPSRIFSELRLILMEKEPLRALKRMEGLDILRLIHPGFRVDEKTEELLHELQKVFAWYDLLFRDESYNRWVLLLAALQRTLSPGEVEDMAKNICLAAGHRDRLLEINISAEKTAKSLDREGIDDVSLYHLLANLNLETLLFVMASAGNERVREMISRFITELKETSVEAGGEDLKNLGIKPGPLYREITGRLLDEKLKGTVKSREDEIGYVKKHFLKMQGIDA